MTDDYSELSEADMELTTDMDDELATAGTSGLCKPFLDAVSSIQDLAGDEYIPTGTNITAHLRELKAKLPMSAKTSTLMQGFDQDDFISFGTSGDEGETIDKEANTTDTAESGGLSSTPVSAGRRLSGRGPSGSADQNASHLERRFMSVDPLTPVPVPPWVPNRRPYSSDMLLMLDQEIDDYIDYVVTKVWKDATVHVFGSFQTKLYLPSSDVDIVVVGQACIVPQCLRTLAKAFTKAGTFSRMEVIEKTKVPIIKAVDALTQFSLDISFNIVNGIQSADIVKRFINDPYYGEGVMPLMLIIKQFLVQRHLNEVFGGGLGSYGLLIMVSSFLMMHPKLQSGQIRARNNLGILLLEFFELYGKHFDFQNVGIGLSFEKTWYTTRSPSNPSPRGPRQSVLILLDPQDSSNDVGRGSYNFMSIRREFARAFNILQAMIGAGYERQHQRDMSLDPKPSSHFNSPSHVRFGSDSDHNNSRQGGREMVTMLGSILTIGRPVLEHREFVQKRYDDLPVLDPAMWELLQKQDVVVPEPVVTLKRKRGGRNDDMDDTIVYVAVSSDDENDTESEADLRAHPAKRSRADRHGSGGHAGGNHAKKQDLRRGLQKSGGQADGNSHDEESSEGPSWGDLKYSDDNDEESSEDGRGPLGHMLSASVKRARGGGRGRIAGGHGSQRGGNRGKTSRLGDRSHTDQHSHPSHRRDSSRGARGGAQGHSHKTTTRSKSWRGRQH
ncbi:hypothetical protein BASA60_000492 [Batrachochytrium salamandrivorans]|nr:hypothetical protein BASA60_000492 [Batrachochytrium salamandrivorans]